MTLALDNDFWRFSCALYPIGDVSAQCLALQDQHGVDVNLLLFAAWLGSRGCAATDGAFRDAAHRVADWHASIVRPLRTARRAVKERANDDDLGRFRGRLKAIELEAERIEQAILFQWASERFGAAGTPDECMASNVRRFLATLDVPDAAANTAAEVLADAARDLPGAP